MDIDNKTYTSGCLFNEKSYKEEIADYSRGGLISCSAGTKCSLSQTYRMNID